MLRYVLLSLFILPLTSIAETVCLEGPHGSGCHIIETTKEAFHPASAKTLAAGHKKSSTVAPTTLYTQSNTTTPTKQRIAYVITPNQRKANSTIPTHTLQRQQGLAIAKERIRQRAELIEARVKQRQTLK